MTAEIAVVVGNYQGEHVLRDCLESLEAQTRPPRSRSIVVDGALDGPQRRSSPRARRAGVCTHRTAASASSTTSARAPSTSDYVLLSNNDVAYEPDCLEHLAAALDADAQPLRRRSDAARLGRRARRSTRARRSRRGRLWREYLPGLASSTTVPADGVVPTVSAHGAAMLVRRELLLELGGFDESFFMEWEDLDLCWRAWAARLADRLRPAGAAAPPRRRRHDDGPRARAAERIVAPQPDALRAQVPARLGRGARHRRRAAPTAEASARDRSRARAGRARIA